ncbi:MAG: AAA family ATPase [Cyanobacteria bacterium J06635_15]
MSTEVTPALPQRIVVIGTSGSGKTTLAKAIATKLTISHIELDALHWEPNWIEAEPAMFLERVKRATISDRWVTDGNYSQVRDLLWQRADTIVWLDYARTVVMRRVIWRTLKRGIFREPLWNGNRESLWGSFLTRDSIILWAWQTYERRRRDYPVLLNQAQYEHLQVIRLRSPQETHRWFTTIH